MDEIKRLTEQIKKLKRQQEAFKKKRKRTERALEGLCNEHNKSRRKNKFSKRREITIKFI